GWWAWGPRTDQLNAICGKVHGAPSLPLPGASPPAPPRGVLKRERGRHGQPPDEIPARPDGVCSPHLPSCWSHRCSPRGVVIPLVVTARQLVSPSGFNGSTKSFKVKLLSLCPLRNSD